MGVCLILRGMRGEAGVGMSGGVAGNSVPVRYMRLRIWIVWRSRPSGRDLGWGRDHLGQDLMGRFLVGGALSLAIGVGFGGDCGGDWDERGDGGRVCRGRVDAGADAERGCVVWAAVYIAGDFDAGESGAGGDAGWFGSSARWSGWW